MTSGSMATVTTQTDCVPSDPRSPGPLLKLGSPTGDAVRAVSKCLQIGNAGVFDLSPETALQLLCNNVEKLNAYSAETPEHTDPASYTSTPAGGDTPGEEGLPVKTVGLHCGDHEDVRSQEEALQLALLSRKFLSKKIPPISIKDYLLRLHRYCPMSTAVYLATSFYITRMVLVEKFFHVTPKNMHRLVLAGLLVATKALEDLSYPHSRVAKVGGVSEQELSKLEISFCFLANFELRVDAQILMDEAGLQSLQESPQPEQHTNS